MPNNIKTLKVTVKLTPLLPNRSASFPLITAPNIAPTVDIEPKTEYCKMAPRGKGEERKSLPNGKKKANTERSFYEF